MGSLGNQLSHKLDVPHLVPVFPRPEKQKKIYTLILTGCHVDQPRSIKRIDPVDYMIQTKRETSKSDIKSNFRFDVSYSDSGVFANRFACLLGMGLPIAGGTG
jgi:hypothetical protein